MEPNTAAMGRIHKAAAHITRNLDAEIRISRYVMTKIKARILVN